MDFRYIQYIGRKPLKRDSLYQTGVVWNGYGDIQPVAADAAPRLLNHPDVYVEVDRETYETAREQAEGSGVDTSALDRARERVQAGGDPRPVSEVPKEGGEETPDVAQDEANGLADANEPQADEPERGPQKPEKPVSQLGKAKLAEYADREFGETIDVASMDVEDVRNHVRQLMAEHGVK